MNTGKTLFQFEKRSWNKISESLEEAHEHGKVLFQLFWNKLEQTPQSLAYLLFPRQCVRGASELFLN